MELSIQKWGNSAALRLPAALLEQVRAAIGDKLIIEIRPEGILLAPARPRYSQVQLIARCDECLAEWTGIKDEGREASCFDYREVICVSPRPIPS
ncbi:AbrB/MazE/SpoVT family DNA-binding domain-containing protein [Caballeronia sp. LZ065]|uniref:AbrB/MazE/SpoVT family DNA-binding domain-containing protein n=1 Tax=Caballeronia sp. LZ065 TaxID=3038571 RepID=UPI00285F63C5|nr:AbrB/MazE/SpoVT family DNA-binding domain-containing protein [Caballeronia sp. LZ065]MDR5783946.1 AbrB/MazE/SpoVT family DNA-binding domain-containing protein [Caballeronia sp. LZ065]